MFSRKTIMNWHLTNNLYPPIEGDIDEKVEFALAAIDLSNDDKVNDIVKIKINDKEKSLYDTKKGKEVTAYEIIENWKLQIYCDSDLDNEELGGES